MAKIEVDYEGFKKLKGKVVVITGGANGIGKTAARLFYEYGANVVIGDLDEQRGKELAGSFGDRGHFVKTNITDWASQSELFRSTFHRFGSVDCVCANAGMSETRDFLWEEQFDAEGNLKEPNLSVIDVNLKGSVKTAKLAMHYFQKNPTPGGALVFTGSAASYFGAAEIINYATAKHGLLGLMRSLAIRAFRSNFRVNLVAPWLTATEFSSELHGIWGERPINTQQEVAEAILTTCADETLSGRGLFVAKQIVDCEVPLHQLESQWLGPEVAQLFDMGRVVIEKAFGRDPSHYLEIN